MNAASRFFDTNVLLYLLSGDEAKSNAAETLVASGGIVSVQVLNEFASVATRKLHMLIREVRELLGTVRRLCTVHSLSVELHDEGLEVAARYQLSVYDAMVVASARQAGCTSLYTEDPQDGMAIVGLTIQIRPTHIGACELRLSWLGACSPLRANGEEDAPNLDATPLKAVHLSTKIRVPPQGESKSAIIRPAWLCEH